MRPLALTDESTGRLIIGRRISLEREIIMNDTTPKYRWIMYVSQTAFGGHSFDVQRVTGLGAARAAYEEYCKAVYSDDCSAGLYPYSEDDWASAVEFRDTGCPFDYPTKVIERGPHGGIRIENA